MNPVMTGDPESKKPLTRAKEPLFMEKKTFAIPRISCNHCVMTIKNELSEIEGVKNVEGQAETKTIAVTWDAPATLEKIKKTLDEINYPAA
jgi:copper chaperone